MVNVCCFGWYSSVVSLARCLHSPRQRYCGDGKEECCERRAVSGMDPSLDLRNDPHGHVPNQALPVRTFYARTKTTGDGRNARSVRGERVENSTVSFWVWPCCECMVLMIKVEITRREIRGCLSLCTTISRSRSLPFPFVTPTKS